MSPLPKLFAHGPAQPSIDRAIQEGLAQLQDGRFLEASKRLEAKKDDPGLTQYEAKELLLGLTECYFKRFLNLRGREIATQALPLCAALNDSFGIGVCLYSMGKNSEAIPALSQAIQRPDIQRHAWKHGKGLITLGHCYYGTKRKEQGLALYQQAIQACSKAGYRVGEAEAHLWLGLLAAEPLLHAGIRDAGTAVSVVEASRELYAPSNYLLLSLAALQKMASAKEAATAYEHLKRTTELATGTEDHLTLGFAFRTLAWLDIWQSDRDQGETHILKAAENFQQLDNPFFAGNCYFALALVKKEQPASLRDAADLFGKAAKSYEKAETSSVINIGNAYLQQGHCILNLSQMARAASAQKHPLYAIPDISGPLVSQARLAYETAIAWLSQDKTRGRDSLGPTELNLGKCLLLQGDAAGARKHFQSAQEYYRQAGRTEMARRAEELVQQTWGR